MTVKEDGTEYLAFGYRVPEGVKTAWGARLIIKQDGYVDFLYDRQDAIGPDDDRGDLLSYLNKGRMSWKETLSDMLRKYELTTSDEKKVVLLDDGMIRVEGSPQASYGYFYVVAYFTKENADG